MWGERLGRKNFVYRSLQCSGPWYPLVNPPVPATGYIIRTYFNEDSTMSNSSNSTGWWSDPVKREIVVKKMREAALKKWEDPDYRRRMSEARKEYAHAHPEEMARQTRRMRERKTPETYRKCTEGLLRWLAVPENRRKRAEGVRRAMEDPEVRRRRGKAVLAAKRTPEARRRAREIALRSFDPAKHHHAMPKRSRYEEQVLEFVASIYTGPIQRQAHVFPEKAKMELDIYLPELRLGIEVQGDYWHSKPEVQRRDREKQEMCLDAGISLFVLWVDDWKAKYSDEREETERRLRDFVLELSGSQARPHRPRLARPRIASSHDEELSLGLIPGGRIRGLRHDLR